MGQLLSRDLGGKPGFTNTNQTSEVGVFAAYAAE